MASQDNEEVSILEVEVPLLERPRGLDMFLV